MALLHLLLFYTQRSGQVLWEALCCLCTRQAPSWICYGFFSIVFLRLNFIITQSYMLPLLCLYWGQHQMYCPLGSTFFVFHCFGWTPFSSALQGMSPQMALLHLLLFYMQQSGQVLWESLCCLCTRQAPSWICYGFFSIVFLRLNFIITQSYLLPLLCLYQGQHQITNVMKSCSYDELH
jgi:hypothetical protein